MRKQVIVIGLGRFGSKVSTSLYNLGHDVLAIDKNIERTQLITGQVTHPVTGDATNENVLREFAICILVINNECLPLCLLKNFL